MTHQDIPDYCGLLGSWEGETQIRDTIDRMASEIFSRSASLLWPEKGLPVELLREQIHVWAWKFSDRSEPSDSDLKLLDEQERARTKRFYFAPDKVRYSVCHANMRRILGSYLHKSPESLVYREAQGGKPELILITDEPPLRFNLSHSKSIALLAISLGSEVGIDVEDVRPIERDVATRFFSPAEIASMAPLDGEAWFDAFYRCWTCKEAILKAEGMGLRIPLDSFDVSVLADQPAALLAARPQSKLSAYWHLHSLVPSLGSMAALASNSSIQEIQAFSFIAATEESAGDPSDGTHATL